MKNNEIEFESSDIAIIGMAGRFPKAENLDIFWERILSGEEMITDFSADFADSDIENKTNYVCAKGILENSDYFDIDFFGLTPKEAILLDPQQRVFLECVWWALEDAGYCVEKDGTKIGVFAGMNMSSYALNLSKHLDLSQHIELFQFMINSDKDYLSLRTSYELNLSGPSLTIQTACSTSLVSVAVGCQMLLDYECNIAVAGGVSISFPERQGYHYAEGMTSSPDGHCRPFDARANGAVPGNGVGVVVLKRLSDALEDGDLIHAIIKGYGINNDGSAKMNFTTPSGQGQAKAIKAALAAAEVPMDSIDYIETPGTATELGDSIEISALKSVYQKYTNQKGVCAIGSVKANIGHLDSAAGIAGLIKTVLSLKHKKITPQANFSEYNKKLEIEESPFYVNTTAKEWKSSPDHPRRAGVSSFGIGGTNAHVILEEAPEANSKSAQILADEEYSLILSAVNKAALIKQIETYKEYLETTSDTLPDICYSAQISRKHFSCRVVLAGKTKEEIVDKINGEDYSIRENNDLSELIWPDLFSDMENCFVKNKHNQLQFSSSESSFAARKNACIANLYINGFDIDWDHLTLNQKNHYTKVRLPQYTFQQERYGLNEFVRYFTKEQNTLPSLDKILSMTIDQQVKILSPLIVQVFSTEIGDIDEAKINERTTIFDLGLSSLILYAIKLRIDENISNYGIRVPIEYLHQKISITKLAEMISGEIVKQPRILLSPQDKKNEKNFLAYSQLGYFVDTTLAARCIAFRVSIVGPLKTERLEFALNKILKRHEVFWYKMSKWTPTFTVTDYVPFKLSIITQQDDGKKFDRESAKAYFEKEFRKPFPLNETPLLKCYLIKISDTEFDFGLITPHIIIDGMCTEIFFNEVAHYYYNDTDLPALTVNYRDNINWERKLLSIDSEKNYKFWNEHVKNHGIYYLPTKYLESRQKMKQGNLHSFLISDEIDEDFSAYCRANSISVEFGYLLIFRIVLYFFNKQKVLCAFYLRHGRYDIRFENVMGNFVNLDLYKISADENFTFANLVENFKSEQLITAPYQNANLITKAISVWHQGFPAEKICHFFGVLMAPLFHLYFSMFDIDYVISKVLSQYFVGSIFTGFKEGVIKCKYFLFGNKKSPLKASNISMINFNLLTSYYQKEKNTVEEIVIGDMEGNAMNIDFDKEFYAYLGRDFNLSLELAINAPVNYAGQEKIALFFVTVIKILVNHPDITLAEIEEQLNKAGITF
jgi:3-oxoacyl-(acyl-carrier-protein) synthase